MGKPIAVQLIARITKEKSVAQLVGAFHRKIAKGSRRLEAARSIASYYNLLQTVWMTPSFKDESAATYLSQLTASWVINPANFKASELIKYPVFGFLNFYTDDGEELFDKKEDVKAMVAAMEI